MALSDTASRARRDVSDVSARAPGINGGLIRREERGPGTVNTIDVPSVDEFTSKIELHGGKVLAPKMAIPGIGWFASCEDSEGNAFGLMQNDPAAS